MAMARGSDGSYFPVSMELTVWRETPSASPSAACDSPLASRRSRTSLRTAASPPTGDVRDAERDDRAGGDAPPGGGGEHGAVLVRAVEREHERAHAQEDGRIDRGGVDRGGLVGAVLGHDRGTPSMTS